MTSNVDSGLFNYRTFLMSLPWITSKFIKNKINKPLKIDWKRFDEKKVRISSKNKSLLNSKKLKVGFAWSGRVTHLRDQVRTMDINLLNDLFKLKEIDFSLFKNLAKRKILIT